MNDNPNRRWCQFSVKSLLVMLTLLSAVLAFLVTRVERQRAVVERVKQLGGRVQYSSQPITESEMLRKEPWHVRQLRKYLPVDYVDEVQGVDLSFTGATDEDLRNLTDLAQLKRLDLTGTKVTDAGLVHISKLSKLTDLFLAHTDVTDTGITPLFVAEPYPSGIYKATEDCFVVGVPASRYKAVLAKANKTGVPDQPHTFNGNRQLPTGTQYVFWCEGKNPAEEGDAWVVVIVDGKPPAITHAWVNGWNR